MSRFYHMILRYTRKNVTQTVVTVAGILLSAAMVAAVIRFLLVIDDENTALLPNGSTVRSVEVRP